MVHATVVTISRRRRKMPIWLVRRCYYGPNRSHRWRSVGLYRARNESSAIRKAAFEIKHIALLQAIRLGEDGKPCSKQ